MASLCDGVGLVPDGDGILTLSAKLTPYAHLKSIFIFPLRTTIDLRHGKTPHMLLCTIRPWIPLL